MNKYEDTTYKNFLNDKKNFKEFLRDFTDIEIFKDIAENAYVIIGLSLLKPYVVRVYA